MKKIKDDIKQPAVNITTSNKRKFSLTDKLLLFLAVLLLTGAIGLFLWNPVQNYLRGQKTQELLNQIEQGNVTVIVDANALPVNGEELPTIMTSEETAEVTENTTVPAQTAAETAAETAAVTEITPVPTKYDPAEKLTLTAFGTFSIEKINLNIPLWVGAGIVPLRYGAGILENGIMPGQVGNSVILGHRMKTYGSLFNRLNEIAVGDIIVITAVDGTVITYTVDTVIPELDPAELVNYIQGDSGTGGQRITLVTCTPVGVGSHRIVVIAQLVT